jgi:long-chain-fatty-acid--CoA ligase ACSBG
MVSHDNLTWTGKATLRHLVETGFGCGGNFKGSLSATKGKLSTQQQAGERLVSYLPLSHIAAQLLDVVVPVLITAGLGGSTSAPPAPGTPVPTCCVSFARPDALRGSIGNTLRDVQPTVFLGVPRVWEKIQEKLLEIGASVTGAKKVTSGVERILLIAGVLTLSLS